MFDRVIPFYRTMEIVLRKIHVGGTVVAPLPAAIPINLDQERVFLYAQNRLTGESAWLDLTDALREEAMKACWRIG